MCRVGRHQKQLPIELGRTIVYGAGFVNSAGTGSGCPKTAEKIGNYQIDIGLARCLEPETIKFAHCPKFAADCAARAVAAVSAGAAVSRRPSGLDSDGLALFDPRADVAAMGRSQRDVAVAAAFGGRLGGCEILQPSWHRLGCTA